MDIMKRSSGTQKTKKQSRRQEPIEPHELAGSLTGEQRDKLVDGLIELMAKKRLEKENSP